MLNSVQREIMITNYFQSWINKRIEVIEETFSENAVYSECYGPEYHGIIQLLH